MRIDRLLLVRICGVTAALALLCGCGEKKRAAGDVVFVIESNPADLDKGNFQLSYSIWVGANNDPDIFDLVFSSKKVPPNGRNRGRYRNARVDVLIDEIRGEMDQAKRKELCSEVQKIVAEDLPYVPLWYVDQVSVHARRLPVELTPTGDFDFLEGERFATETQSTPRSGR